MPFSRYKTLKSSKRLTGCFQIFAEVDAWRSLAKEISGKFRKIHMKLFLEQYISLPGNCFVIRSLLLFSNRYIYWFFVPILLQNSGNKKFIVLYNKKKWSFPWSISSYLLSRSLMKNFIFCVVIILCFKSLRAWEKTIYMKLKPTTLLKVALHHGCFYFL